ncbi:MAG TPA: hypothetical protein VFM43_08115 [Gaiellaceae bacterium]|nr:hypothetical protein [Gaiellaceae bacterium]
MQTEIISPGLRELDQRSGGGLEVTLLWSERTGSVFVCVEDGQASSGFHFVVDPADALDAFHHPYAYRRRRPRALPHGTAKDAAAA